ncbi:MAG: nucleotide exchange factor GrpE [Candidatus Magasanikbacteria bacterium RIFCSPHIGHO2_01_FULL_41_23]|uniref:Protein GrpE n=1 Tax=Candidatus Magasanikbacteria bacterium RIFCSPLOWO2_01_FULL_40_15 TaxID=1798686 RepID=A0A1F6N0L5_9BACT|nr:MAG: nucleotide exchange factor GrpE [Candidatus Magasanikbacteria bacterium RIFCSPHIGHO2_01_FULL_41_23]OGH74710.1 MAG: nucleotide exchange factor GrpE [Candidatus Magasanikbacteria bacterium RIFCSPHIGHO2_12_FULL_41_16]OGH77424.1 MAG: nucleotide exchange factor GrpE [Candidatus Magasanikbacteria bacterium RIFCSPLOWO2_01_FULL_40_15]
MTNIDDNQTTKPIMPEEDVNDTQNNNAQINDEAGQLQKENETLRTGWQRAVADYQNLQREVAEQKKDWAAWSELRVLEEFIPVYDNFKKAFVSVPNVVEESQTESSDGKKWLNWSQGIGYIMKQFGDILKAHQIEEIKTVGEMFDPRMHDSVGEEVSEMPEHTIIREIDGGYIMKGKVVKVAKVIVAKKAD